MKKVLLAGTAIVGLAVLAQPAHAELKLDLGGYFSGYGVFSDNNEPAGAANSLRDFDLRRDTEVHVSGETTLDNGLTVGFHTEQALGNTGAALGDGTQTDEAYAYFSGSWGRVNLGSEDGAAYLLQVAAPGADSNTDGLRTYIQALAPTTNQTQFFRSHGTGVGTQYNNVAYTFSALDGAFGGGTVIDYDHTGDPTAANTDRISYLTPKFSGFQAGVSYAPEQGQNIVGNNVAAPTIDSNAANAFAAGVALATTAATATTNAAGMTQFEDIWEASARYDGEFSGFGFSLGGGYSSADIEAPAVIATGAFVAGVAATNNGAYGIVDGTESWNGGASITWNGFSAGGSYLHTETGVAATVENETTAAASRVTGDVTRETWVGGLGWDNGPFHLGASYLHQETELPTLTSQTAATAIGDMWFSGTSNTVTKTTIGGGYTFGPGMTFRGSVAFGEFEADGFTGLSTAPVAAVDNRFTQVAIGTQIDF